MGLTQSRYTRLAPFRVLQKNPEDQNASSIGYNQVVETSDVKESNTMKGIASNTSSLQKTHTRNGVAVKLRAVQERVMIDRSFANCPRIRHSSPFSLLHFQ